MTNSASIGVRVVPPEALQALLRKSKSFVKYEEQFGRVPDSDRAAILALFSLIELERTFDSTRQQEYLQWTLVKHKKRLEEAHVKRSPAPWTRSPAPWFVDMSPDNRSREAAHSRAIYLAEHDQKLLKERGLRRTLGDELNDRGSLRIWWNKRSETLAPGVLVSNFREALRMLLLLNLSSPESHAICAWCNKEFTRTKTTQGFCSLRCGNAARQARRRRKQKGDGIGTRKTR